MNFVKDDLVWMSYAVETRNECQYGNHNEGEFVVPFRLDDWLNLASQLLYDRLSIAVDQYVDIIAGCLLLRRSLPYGS